MATSPGSYDHHERTSPRRRGKTVSGPFPDFSNSVAEQYDIVQPIETMRFPWSSPSAPTSPTEPTPPSTTPSPAKSSGSGHRRTISGNLLSKFHFLRPSSSGGEDGSGTLRPPTREKRSGSRGDKDKEPTSPTKSFFSRKSIDDDAPQSSSANVSPEKVVDREDGAAGGALASALKQSKGRKRKGSLRKTALLGGKKIFNEGRERKGSFSLLQRSANAAKQKQVDSAQPEHDDAAVLDSEVESPVADEDEQQQAVIAQTTDIASHSTHEPILPFAYQSSNNSTSSDISWPEPAAVSATRLALLTDHAAQTNQLEGRSRTGTMVNDLGSPLDMKSPVSQASYTSTTTDDEDVLTFDRPTKPPPIAANVPPQPPSNSATSYFPSVSSTSSPATRRRSSKRRSPLSRTVPLNASTNTGSSEFGHDYTETAYWGWMLLIATWITFTVGMGSCLEIWSWAWDVGETPYAPPELEDDPTLPIVGYYPALIVLTGVVSWVWITVAWVGMKYFRHAKIEV